jgi:hypothetical protein
VCDVSEAPETVMTTNQRQQQASAGRVRSAVRTLEAHREMLTVEQLYRLGEIIRHSADTEYGKAPA